MHLHLGPVRSSSVLAWLGYAEDVLQRQADAHDIADDVVAAAKRFFSEWEAAARSTAEFTWSADVDPELVEYLVHAFYRVASSLAAEADRRGEVVAPAESEDFYRHLVHEVLDALGLDDATRAEFSGHLKSFWPGLEPE